jgi:hypothetical protein
MVILGRIPLPLQCLTIATRALVPREGIIRNHRHNEPLFVLSMVA